MKQYKIVAACLITLSIASVSAMDKSAALKELLPGQPKQLTALKGFNDLYKPDFFNNNIIGRRARLRNAKAFLNYITILLDTVPGSTSEDLPTIDGANLKEQTKQALSFYKLSLSEVTLPKGKAWIIQESAPATVDAAIDQAGQAATSVRTAAASATPAQRGALKTKVTDVLARIPAS